MKILVILIVVIAVMAWLMVRNRPQSTAPPIEPDPVIEPRPESDPVVEPGPPVETEPVITPETQPAEATQVRADPAAGVYHTPDSPGFQEPTAGVVYESEDAAQTAGFTRWDQPR